MAESMDAEAPPGARPGSKAEPLNIEAPSPKATLAVPPATSFGRRATKSWMTDESRLKFDAQGDPDALDEESSQRLVGLVTRFATVMCVVIAFIKVGVYIISQAAVVKTSALDSVGDLIANMITLYTGYRMARTDNKMYPIGNGRFEPIGVLIFSTLMAALMFGNALGNLEEITNSSEIGRGDAVNNFWGAMFGTHKEDDGNKHSWENPEAGYEKLHTLVRGTDISEFMSNVVAKSPNLKDSQKNKVFKDTVLWAAEEEDPELEWGKLLFQNGFLACCATYKCCLWLYITMVAYPKTKATVLQALANDKRNDFIATSLVIVVTFSAKIFEQHLKDAFGEAAPEKVDPLTSMILSCAIIYTWAILLREQVLFLSSPSVEVEILDSIERELNGVDTGYTTEIVAYYSSCKPVVEVSLKVNDGQVPFSTVAGVQKKIEDKLQAMDCDFERVIVIPKAKGTYD